VKYSRKLSEIFGGHVEISSENRAKLFGGKSGFNMSLLSILSSKHTSVVTVTLVLSMAHFSSELLALVVPQTSTDFSILVISFSLVYFSVTSVSKNNNL